MSAQQQQAIKREVEAAADLFHGPAPPPLQPYHLTTVAPRGELVQVSLGNAATWQKFSRQNTEMIVTKAGRRMFPSLSLDISGLEPAKKYELYVTLLLADAHTLKYQRGLWIANGQGETYPPPGCTAGLVYVHPDSPACGRQWTKQEVTFMKMKLTNKLEGFDDPARNGSMIFAYSMHKYLPVVHISEVPSKSDPSARFYTSVVFPGTEFITVTAYQNPELTDLKIQFNPYAKGIRNQTDRSCSFLVDTFRPSLQAMTQQRQQQQLHQQQQQQHLMLPVPEEHQQATQFEFGAYPNQTAAAYGHWQQPPLASGRSSRPQPYSLTTAAAAVASVADRSDSPAAALSQQAALSTEATPTSAAASAAAAAAAAAAVAYYPGQYLYQPHHSYYPGAFYCQQPEQPTDYYRRYCSPPPPQQQQQQQQHPHQQQQQAPACSIIVGEAMHHATPQGCPLASSSHVTDSSPSGVSFNSPDL